VDGLIGHIVPVENEETNMILADGQVADLPGLPWAAPLNRRQARRLGVAGFCLGLDLEGLAMAVKACQDEGQTVCGNKIEGYRGKPPRQGSGQLDLIVVALGKCQRNDVGTRFRASHRAAQQDHEEGGPIVRAGFRARDKPGSSHLQGFNRDTLGGLSGTTQDFIEGSLRSLGKRSHTQDRYGEEGRQQQCP